MSLFLGKIHYWLFNKIRLTEEMEAQILRIGRTADLPVDNFETQASALYDAPLPPASLESLIDHQNIHGWLQHRIAQAESRLAFYVTQMISHQPQLKDEIIKLYGEQAHKIARQSSTVPSTPESMVHSLHDYLLEGMPCDRAQVILNNTEYQLDWQYSPCLHKEFWEAVDGDVRHFYDFREAWISSFVKTLQPTWVYEVTADGIHHMTKEDVSQ